MQTILVTGCAGFIGSHLTERFLEEGSRVIGVDNFDNFYSRLIKEGNMRGFFENPRFSFCELDLKNELELSVVNERIDLVVHLAGKAGVRPSIEDPQGYIDNNITATRNVLDFMRKNNIRRMAFASSSSIYGNAGDIPFRESQRMDKPESPYAFTKKSCELMNYTYHKLYGLDILNLRFFTVFGARQRPDLAIHKFLRLMRNDKPIPMFGDGSTARDYTFIDDIIDGIVKGCDYLFSNEGVYDIINLGNSSPVLLKDMIDMLANEAGVIPRINMLPMQDGDVNQTYADISYARELIGYNPQTPFLEGVRRFIVWYDKGLMMK